MKSALHYEPVSIVIKPRRHPAPTISILSVRLLRVICRPTFQIFSSRFLVGSLQGRASCLRSAISHASHFIWRTERLTSPTGVQILVKCPVKIGVGRNRSPDQALSERSFLDGNLGLSGLDWIWLVSGLTFIDFLYHYITAVVSRGIWSIYRLPKICA